MGYRFHVLGIPHTATNKEHLACAYTQKVLKLCRMLKDRGHTVIHYGNERSMVLCDENVVCTTHDDLVQTYGDELWKRETYKFDVNDRAYVEFYANATAGIWRRKRPGDFLLCMWGHGHRAVANAHPDMIHVEPGIGYAGGFFAKYKAFESYAILHAYAGLQAVGAADQVSWYDWVIPNYYDPDDFEYRERKEDYLLFLGRVTSGKGIHIAIQIAERTGRRLIVAGQRAGFELPKSVDYVGFADEETRRRLLSHAFAVVCPTMFVEPFCGVHVEAMFSGTPVITTDWGAFTEYNLHGTTGFRCRTMEQFVWAVNHAGDIKPADCRRWAVGNFSLDRVGNTYQEFFDAAMAVHNGQGWYQERPDRADLNFLARVMDTRS